MISPLLKKYHLVLLSVLSGLLMAFSWYPYGFAPLMFVAWIPLLYVEKYISDNPAFFSRGSIVLYSYLTFFVWNAIDTWWVCLASIPGGIAATVLNALFMALTFGLFHWIKNRIFKSLSGYIVLIFVWIAYEYLHLDWDLSWSWLVLGNVLAPLYTWIQWYEYTGAFGGTLWILLVNILFFISLQKFLQQDKKKALLYLAIAVVSYSIPVSLSYIRYLTYEEKGEMAEVVVIQPNVDPYYEEYNTPPEEMIHNLLRLSRSQITDNTSLVVCPESAIQEGIWEDRMNEFLTTDSVNRFLEEFPNCRFITGASTKRFLTENEVRKPFARRFRLDTTKYYYYYNTALCFENEKDIQFYHKAKLVPGVEKMPFHQVMKHFEKFAIDLGGSTGSLGIDEERSVFASQKDKIVAAPVICYESIYGEFVTDYIKKGANLITIITNDGWWGNTPGYRQHFQYARLRAIETRRCIARSANTGISGFFNQRGDDFQSQKWWTEVAIKQNVALNTEKTYYVQAGDYIAKTSLFLSGLLLIISLVVRFKRK